MWYVYIKNIHFAHYWTKKDPEHKLSHSEILSKFLVDVGTERISSENDMKRIPTEYHNDTFYSYVELPEGFGVTYCLSEEDYHRRLKISLSQ